MMTFAQAIFALGTFVHICNISAVIDPILTKLFGPNILVNNLFLEPNSFGPNIFGQNVFLNRICFMN